MKHLGPVVCLLFFVLAMTGDASAQNPNCEVNPTTLVKTGKINGVFHTSCFDWVSGDGTLAVNSVSRHNDTRRLKDALVAAVGKLVFDEGAYYINDTLQVASFRTLVGTGRSTLRDPTNIYYPFYSSLSRVVQVANGKAVFRIGGGTSAVAIRDMALATTVTGSGNTTVGILGTNSYLNTANPPVEVATEASSAQSLDFEFTNLTFEGFDKGIYVTAREFATNPPVNGAEGVWRFDNVKLDHAQFQGCRIGVHVNSRNSGWSMKNLLLEMPAGDQIPLPTYDPVKEEFHGGITDDNRDAVSVGLYLERIGYSTVDLAIGDGPYPTTNTSASALIYVGHHSNLNIQSSIDEGFKNSIYVYGGDINSPINLSNNVYQSQLIVRNSTIMSSANQFSNFYDSPIAPARAFQNSKIYSIGDRFCLDYGPANSVCAEQPPNGSSSVNTATYTLDASSQMMFSSNPYTTTVASLRFGPLNYQYDILRDNDGILSFNGVQGSGAGGFSIPGYAGYKFKTAGGEVNVNYDGSVTYGSKTYTQLISNANLKNAAPPPDGTAVFCSDCTKTTPCSQGTGANGAIAKRLHGTWDCD